MTNQDKKSPLFYICAVLCVLGIYFAYPDYLFSQIGRVFLFLFGKDLSSRSMPFQLTAILIVLSGIVILMILADRILFSKIKKERIYIFLLTTLSIPAIQTLIICANQILRRDDYWEIADAHSYGFPGSMIFEITHHNGRYLSWGIKSLYAIFPPIPFINILLFLNICLLFTGFYLLVSELLTYMNSQELSQEKIRIRSLLYSGALVIGIIPLSSNVWEVWFWGSGTWVYGLSISLCVISFGLILCIVNGTFSGAFIRVLTAIVCFMACGGSELSTLSLASFLFYLLCWKRITTKKWNRIIIFYIIEVCICCLGILIMSGSISAAGEFASADSGKSSTLFSQLPQMLGSIIDRLWRYSTVNSRILILLLFTFFLFGVNFKFERQISKKTAGVSLLLFFTANYILLLNESIDYVPSRVVTVPLCWIFSALALLSFSAGSFTSEKIGIRSPHRLLPLCCLLIVINYSFFYTENIGFVRQIRQSWVIRDKSLQDDFDSDKTVITCSIPSLGSSHNDLEEDPNELFNIAMRMYLRVPAVSAERICPPFDQEP